MGHTARLGRGEVGQVKGPRRAPAIWAGRGWEGQRGGADGQRSRLLMSVEQLRGEGKHIMSGCLFVRKIKDKWIPLYKIYSL